MPLHRLLFNGEEILVPPKEELREPRRQRMRKLQTENKRPIRQVYLVTIAKPVQENFYCHLKTRNHKIINVKEVKRKCLSRAIQAYA
jgi:hypothetical protein